MHVMSIVFNVCCEEEYTQTFRYVYSSMFEIIKSYSLVIDKNESMKDVMFMINTNILFSQVHE